MGVKRVAWLVMLCFVVWVGACSEGPEPRDPGGGSTPPGGSGGGGDDPDVGHDVEDDAEDDAGPALCELEPRMAVDPDRQPCCFNTLDCVESDANEAADMVCYGASCVEDGEGVCRVPPEVGLCWTRRDCEEGEQCVGAVTGTCEEPMDPLLEVPGNCQ